jgi:ankyrin repeat protein
MRNRGYSTERINTLDTAYHNEPTPLQRASYHSFLVRLVKGEEVETLSALMSAGLSPNAANMFGESICHLTCRLGLGRVLKVLIDCGCDLEVCDDYGRTPLHDACWAPKPAIDVVDFLMTAGCTETHHLFTMVDSRGCSPLSYVRRKHWSQWIQFLESKKDTYWPVRSHSDDKKEAPAITTQQPFSRPIPDPVNALSLELASMVASGAIPPSEARKIMEAESSSEESDESDYSTSEDDTESNSDNDDDDDEDETSSCFGDEDYSIIQESLAKILQPTDPKAKKFLPCTLASNLTSTSNSSVDEGTQLSHSTIGRNKPIPWSQ